MVVKNQKPFAFILWCMREVVSSTIIIIITMKMKVIKLTLTFSYFLHKHHRVNHAARGNGGRTCISIT